MRRASPNPTLWRYRARLESMNRPERTCIGCRGRGVKSELLRLVEKTAVIAVDLRQTEPGRGAYLHRDPDCLQLAVRRRAVGRALRTTLPDGGRLAEVVGPYVTADGLTA